MNNIDMQQAERDFAAGIAHLFAGLGELPTGTVKAIDEAGLGFVRLSVQTPEGIGETWLIRFAPGEPFEIVQLG